MEVLLAYKLTCCCHQLTPPVLALKTRQEWFPAYVRTHHYHRPPGAGRPFLAERLASLDVPGKLNYEKRHNVKRLRQTKRNGKKCYVSNLKQWKVRKCMYLVCLFLGEHYLDPGLHCHHHHPVLTSLPHRLHHLVLILKTKKEQRHQKM